VVVSAAVMFRHPCGALLFETGQPGNSRLTLFQAGSNGSLNIANRLRSKTTPAAFKPGQMRLMNI
jgi:hypothetical protein